MSIKNVMLQLHQRPIAYYPVYRDITGSTTAAILLSQLMYWFTAMDGNEFYKTDAEIMEETRLSSKELRNAKHRIKSLHFVTVTKRGVPCRTFYDFDLELLADLLGESSLAERAKLNKPKGLNKKSRKGQTITENTTDITPNNTQEKIAAKAAPENSPLNSSPEIKERKKVAAKKEKPAPLPFQMWEVWSKRHEQLHDETPTQDPKFFNHLKQLAAKFSTRIEAQGGDVTDENVCYNFGMFLDMLIEKGDQWYKTNFTPDIFNSKFLNIIQLLKREHNEQKQRTSKYEEAIASFAK